MEISFLRKNSLGLKGTYRNARHHAKPAIPIINEMVSTIYTYKEYIKVWKQGHTVHRIELNDGRKLQFRPFMTSRRDDVEWGVEVHLYVSRKESVLLMQVTDLIDAHLFELFLSRFVECKENEYGKGSGDE